MHWWADIWRVELDIVTASFAACSSVKRSVMLMRWEFGGGHVVVSKIRFDQISQRLEVCCAVTI